MTHHTSRVIGVSCFITRFSELYLMRSQLRHRLPSSTPVLRHKHMDLREPQQSPLALSTRPTSPSSLSCIKADSTHVLLSRSSSEFTGQTRKCLWMLTSIVTGVRNCVVVILEILSTWASLLGRCFLGEQSSWVQISHVAGRPMIHSQQNWSCGHISLPRARAESHWQSEHASNVMQGLCQWSE